MISLEDSKKKWKEASASWKKFVKSTDDVISEIEFDGGIDRLLIYRLEKAKSTSEEIFRDMVAILNEYAGYHQNQPQFAVEPRGIANGDAPWSDVEDESSGGSNNSRENAERRHKKKRPSKGKCELVSYNNDTIYGLFSKE